MSTPRTHFAAQEIAGLPGMPGTVQGVMKKADREGWNFRDVAAKGGPKGKRREYPLSALPAETRDHLTDQLIAALPAPPTEKRETAVAIKAPAELPAPASLKQWQRDTMDARVRLMRLIEQAVASGIRITKAVGRIVEHARNPGDGQLQHIIQLANKRIGDEDGGRTLSERSLWRWWQAWQDSGQNAVALAPKDTELDPETGERKLPAWAPWFIQCYCRPQKPSVAAAIKDMKKVMPADIPLPTQAQAYRLMQKCSTLDLAKGRMTGAELDRVKGFVRRDTSKFQPLDIVLCDGHSFKAYVAHPRHGRHFHPELCAVIDAVTRVIVGWSAGLAESNQTVADALRHAMTVNEHKPIGGMLAIWYTDGGSGNVADVNTDPYLGRYDRLGLTHKTGRPGNPKGRGRIERVNKSLWIPMAKRLPTYTGKDMDKGASRKVYLELVKEVREAKKAKRQPQSKLLIGWFDFLDMAQEYVDDYNRTPHSMLPKIRCPETGRMRHMTPLEAWAKHREDGWSPIVLPEEQLADLFRPRVECTANNGEVRLFGRQWYYHSELVNFHNKKVIVEYEVQDGSRVWVRDIEHQRLICVADFEGNKRDFMCVSEMDVALEKRETTRKKLKLDQIEEIEAERRGIPTVIVEHPPEIEAKRLTYIPAPPADVQPEPRRKVVTLHQSVPEGFRVPDDRHERWQLWNEIDQKIKNAEEGILDEEIRFYTSFRNSATWKAFDKIRATAL